MNEVERIIQRIESWSPRVRQVFSGGELRPLEDVLKEIRDDVTAALAIVRAARKFAAGEKGDEIL
jgi:hypothetical protein